MVISHLVDLLTRAEHKIGDLEFENSPEELARQVKKGAAEGTACSAGEDGRSVEKATCLGGSEQNA